MTMKTGDATDEAGRSRRMMWISAAVVTLLGAYMRFRYLRSHTLSELDPFIPDDAFISLTFARNLCLGDGLVFEGITSNGFQPLYVVVMAALGQIFGFTFESRYDIATFVVVGLGVGIVFAVITIPLVVNLVHRLTGGDWVAAALAGFVFAIQPGLFSHGVNGLETSMALFFFLLVWRLTPGPEFLDAPYARLVAIGIALGLAVFARVDLLLLGIFFGISSLADLYRRRDVGRWLCRNAAVVGPMLAVVGPWWVYAYLETGAFIPTSGHALRSYWLIVYPDATTLYSRSTSATVVALVSNTPWFIVLGLPLVGLYALRRRRDEAAPFPWRPFALPMTFVLIIPFFYAWYVFATHFFPRYLMPVSAVLVITVFVVASLLTRDIRSRLRVWGAGLVALLLSCAFWFGVPGFSHPSLRMLMKETLQPAYYPVAKWARNRFEAGTVVGTSQSGALAYWAPDIVVVNLDGVVSEPAREALEEATMTEYMLERGVEHLVDWPAAFPIYQARSQTDFARVFERVGTIRNITTWNNPWVVYTRRGLPAPLPSEKNGSDDEDM